MISADVEMEAPQEKRRRRGRPTLSNEELLDTALNVFLENGFEKTSVEGICAAAGMAKRTVYARYPDKTALFRASITRAIEDWLIPVERLRAAETTDLRGTLLNLAKILLENVLSPAGMRLLKLSNAVSLRMPEIAAYNTRMGTEPTLAYLADLFARRMIASDAPSHEADEAALAFLHLVVGGPAMTAAWGVVLDEEARDRHTRYCVDLFLHGALPGIGEDTEMERLKDLLSEALEKVNVLQDVLAKGTMPSRS